MPEVELLRSDEPINLQQVNLGQMISDSAGRATPTLSFEFFPPKDDEGETTLWKAFDRLLAVSPDYVSVTYGAGGSYRDTSLAVVDRMAKQITTIGHLTCVGSSRESTRAVIKRFEDAGVHSILALRGDPPRDNPDALQGGELKTALDLVDLVAAETDLEIGVAAFPEVHPESPNMAHDAKVLSLKQAAGAKYAMTQLFFTVESYLELIEASRLAGASLPIIPGLMPIGNAAKVVRMAEMSGAKLPVELLKKLNGADEASARIIGMDYSIKLASDLLTAGAPGLHIFSLNFSKAALEVARGAGLCR